jgi:hypothetical protein
MLMEGRERDVFSERNFSIFYKVGRGGFNLIAERRCDGEG